MIVYTFGPAWQTIDMSPFCVKLQTWLRMAGLPYESRVGAPNSMPTQKLPAARIDGQLVGDSGLIIDQLRRQHGDPLGDDTLDSVTRAEARALRALMESELYFAAVHFRWVGEPAWQVLKPELLAYLGRLRVPGLMAPLLANSVRRRMLGQLKAQGIGRHADAQIGAIAAECVTALGDYLADKPFILGDAPRTLDAMVFAVVHCVMLAPFESPLKDAVRARDNLIAYHDRVCDRWWPEVRRARDC